ncbi:MAG: HU family DNA-binding protein [Alloprevotella sp.]|nr:HU family DNA-binding protein [Alloprevotella sp.]
MKYIVKQETKPTLSTFGKYKAVASHQQTIETRQILKEVCENNPIGEGEVTAVVWKLAQVIKRHLRKGDKVRLDDFGLLKLEIESDKVDSPRQFKPKKHIRGVRLHFIPESEKGKPELYKGIKYEKVR